MGARGGGIPAAQSVVPRLRRDWREAGSRARRPRPAAPRRSAIAQRSIELPAHVCMASQRDQANPRAHVGRERDSVRRTLAMLCDRAQIDRAAISASNWCRRISNSRLLNMDSHHPYILVRLRCLADAVIVRRDRLWAFIYALELSDGDYEVGKIVPGPEFLSTE